MRSVLLLSARVMVLTICVLFITLSILLLSHLSEYAGIREPVPLLAELLYRALVPAVWAGSFLVLFRIVRTPLMPAVALPYLAILTAGLLFAAGLLSLVLQDVADHRGAELSTPSAERLYQIGGATVYFGSVEGIRFEDVVLLQPREQPVLRFYDEAMLDPEENGLLLFHTADRPELLRFTTQDRPWVSTPAAPGYLSLFLAEVAQAREHFIATIHFSLLSGIVLSIALAIYLSSCFVWIRYTRWPLFNALMSLLILRLTITLYAVISVPAFANFAVTLLPPLPEFLVVPSALGAAALLFSLLGLLRPRYRDWKRGVGYA
ncbi:MAG: hypothetical protein EA428_01080 [Spirochaetaceae bacterium]|nr:MAG: hypothetical protein EA428_01080 [Spirochaetaceae bacterium]